MLRRDRGLRGEIMSKAATLERDEHMTDHLGRLLDTWVKRQERLYVIEVLLSLFILSVDYMTGPRVRFPILFVLPIWLAGRCGSSYLTYGLATVLPLVRFGFIFLWASPFSVSESAVNCAIRVAVLVLLGHMSLRVATQAAELQGRVQALESILPICSHCRRIRDANNQWVTQERYITDQLAAKLSHGICPDCLRTHYPSQFMEKGQ
jgi:K+-sensing histidine kinase KdpD